ncbi:uncharacterized protein BX664DRAFT_286040 [Halteromyces radiatus]|uniref:uncharacterized protein n=1 Tax=Halteromyces radiatus TaxID=101107 RepID=UPI00221F3471|nr:uncharacterized protein BX664DRAFT_286040 [Halteromyces radiatus]KAI8081779.1 hypothetical protein BX664DRAFT_286040 [Halteromyces radiatus]
MTNNTLEQYKLVIAYDFGTTYSGASYAFTQVTPEVFDVQKWPHKSGHYYPKTPTLSLYKKNSPDMLMDWGHGAKKMMQKPQVDKEYVLLANFKLNLDAKLKRPALPNGMTAVTAVADYLQALHEHVLDDMTRGFAKNYHPDTFRYCLTVPAMWSDQAKNSMRQAAVRAGLVKPNDPPDRLLLISEPEAAALYCEKMCDQVNLLTSDRLMICDAGGGTVDLIVFEVDGPSKLKEITKGMGESCGSMFLDENFSILLQSKLGRQANNLPNAAVRNMIDQFVDIIKPEFDGLDDQYLNLPASVQLDQLCDPSSDCVDEGTLVLRASELKEKVFDPVVEKVISLMESQFQQIPDGRLSCIFLVGGFGSSNYLFQRVQQVFSNRVNQILCPPRAAMAIVRGAVHFGLNPRMITSRVSRRTYGINAGLPFDPELDPLSSRIVRPDGSVRCPTRFLVFVKKNDKLPVDHCIHEEMFIYYGTLQATDIMLYATENDTVPRYYNEPGVHQVAAISVPIPTLPGVAHGERISYSVRMYFGMTEIRVEADFGTGELYEVHCDFDAINRYDDDDDYYNSRRISIENR